MIDELAQFLSENQIQTLQATATDWFNDNMCHFYNKLSSNDLALAFNDKPAAGVWEVYVGAKRHHICTSTIPLFLSNRH